MCILLKGVRHYYLSVQSMSVSGFQKSLHREVGGWVELTISSFFSGELYPGF